MRESATTHSAPIGAVHADDRLLVNARDAAKMMSVSERHLWSVTHPRGSLVPVRIGARCLYSIERLREWISSQTRSADDIGHGCPETLIGGET